ERAGDLAVAAAHAVIGVVPDYARDFVLVERPEHARAGAGRVHAVHTLRLEVRPDVPLLVKLDDVLRVRVQIHRRVVELLASPRTRIGLSFVGLLAGHHTRLAADAEGGVVEHSHRAGRGDLVFRRRGC